MNKDIQFKNAILMEFMRVPTISKSTLVRKLWPYYNTIKEFDEVMAQFDRADIIRMEPHDMYTMPQYQIDELKRLLESKRKS